MGNFCGTDIYNELKEKYPEDLSKYLLGQQLKKGVEQRVNDSKSNLTNTVEKLKQDNLSTIDLREKEVKSQFDQAKTQVDKHYLGGVAALEQTKHAKVEDLLGYSKIQNQFEDMKGQVSKKYGDELAKAQKSLSDLKNQQIGKINQQAPKIQAFDALNDKLKEQVLQNGQKDFSALINSKSSEFFKSIGSKLSPDSFLGNFKNLLPLDGLKSLTELSKGQIGKNLQTLIGNAGEHKAVLG